MSPGGAIGKPPFEMGVHNLEYYKKLIVQRGVPMEKNEVLIYITEDGTVKSLRKESKMM